MVRLFTWLLSALRAPATLLLPFLAKARGSALVFRVVLWTVHLLIVALILVGLHYLNGWLHLDRRIPHENQYLRENWLPILFLLVYLLCWLGWWLWRLLVTEDEYPEFPDITEAWEEACQALRQHRIDLREVPLFLVVGRPEKATAHLFQASKLQLVVKQTPARADAPLHVYATHEAVYVTCEGASVLGRHAATLSGDGDGGAAEVSAAVTDDDDPLLKTARPGSAPGAVPVIEQYLARARQERRELTAEERRKIRGLMRQDRAHQPVVRNAGEVERLGARFEHLCHLLVRDRWPFCPVNGMLLLLPFAATDSDQDALDAGAACQRDLSVARRVLQVNCPTVALVCDVETATGFGEFLARFPEKQRIQRVGQRCPLVPALETRNGRGGEDEARASMLDSLARWICGSVAPGWVYKHFRLEPAAALAGQPLSRTDGGSSPSLTGTVYSRSARNEVVRGNAELFLFMHQLRERQRRLGRLLGKGVILEGEEPILFGGCYLAATGADPLREQAFVAGVFHRLSGEENFVSWTARARGEEASYLYWVFAGQMFLAVLLLATIALGVYVFFWNK